MATTPTDPVLERLCEDVLALRKPDEGPATHAYNQAVQSIELRLRFSVAAPLLIAEDLEREATREVADHPRALGRRLAYTDVLVLVREAYPQVS
jgi:hypothetical protein